MLPVKVASKSLYETSAVSLFTRLPTRTLLGACGIAAPTSCSQSRSHAYFFAFFPTDFRGTERLSQSTNVLHIGNGAMAQKLV